jgi:DNA repair protein RAD5
MPPSKRKSIGLLSINSTKKVTLRKETNVDFLSQLQSLRELGFTQYSDTDLHSCLKLSGYNVQIAAERLISGQFQSPEQIKSSTNPIDLTSTDDSSVRADTMQVKNGTTFFAAKPKKKQHTETSPSKENLPLKSSQNFVPKSKIENMPKYESLPEGKERGLLLCHRWVVGFCTTRNGMIRHNEPLQISTPSIPSKTSALSKKVSNITRFKGGRIEGTLDSKLSNMLSPLIRDKYTSSDNSNNGPLIQVLARGLMEDKMLAIGSEVPLELTITILRPNDFFRLFESDINGPVVDKSSQYFGKNNHKNRAKTANSRAAFDLLQWAHYGNVPTFDIPNDESQDEEEQNIQINKLPKNPHEEDVEENLDNVLLNTDAEDDANPLTKEIFSCQSSELSEESDPVMLTKNGIQLRSYQRQGLHWMMLREENANTKESAAFQKQLQLLADLASSHRSSNANEVGSSTKIVEGIECEVGPVLVSEAIAADSKSLGGENNSVVHPLWEKRFLWYREGGCKSEMIYTFYVNELLQVASKIAPRPPKEVCGGILADSMGLGKTVICIALIAKDIEKNQLNSSLKFSCDSLKESSQGQQSSSDINSKKTTLIVAPLSLIAQWEEEIKTKSSMSCIRYYGEQAKRITSSQISSTDIVITTYGMVQSCFSNDRDSDVGGAVLFTHHFRRVILDEAHLVKNPFTNASKACCSIIADRRWAVTGTPISNSLQDIYGLIKFLHHEPWAQFSFWKKAIRDTNSTQEKKNNNDNATQNTEICRLKQMLSPLLLRRTKDTLINGKKILTLPPVDAKVVSVDFSEEERIFYDALLSRSLSVFDGFVQSGTASKSWFQIFSLLQRLRQACDHLALTIKTRLVDEVDSDSSPKNIGNAEAYGQNAQDDRFLNDLLNSVSSKVLCDEACNSLSYSQSIVETLTQCIQNNKELGDECAICLESLKIDDLAITSCSHVFCRSCLGGILEKSGEKSISCPMCTTTISEQTIISSKQKHGTFNERPMYNCQLNTKDNVDAKDILRSALEGKCSSKMAAIFSEIDDIWLKDPGSKILIFSQYLGMFDLLQNELSKRGIISYRLDGKMSLNERRNTLHSFSNLQTLSSPDQAKSTSNIQRGAVLLASMKACGVGMNLVAASSVFIVDPWWNDAMESQCVARIQRIGQKAPIVRVRKFVVKNSVEEKIVKMQERKKGMVDDILSDDVTGAKSSINPSLEDMKDIFGR